jgi:hypothetical protein
MKINFFLSCIFALLISSIAVADTIELVNGQKIVGTLVGRTGDKVQFEVNGIVTTYNASDVKNITFGSTGQQPVTKAEQPAPPPQLPVSATITVPAGTILMVRTQQPLDTSRQGAGYKFTAKLESDLVAGGKVVAPRGSNVYGQINQAKQAGRLAGRSEMSIIFTGLMINNQIIPMRSGEVKVASSTTSGQDTVRKTARGAIIGGLIDGSDGAKTGAKVGAGVAVITRGSSVNIPAGTLLEVPLAATLSL